ncbi:hypothetical protein [Streptomyces sp. NPDC056713]|uniref:hypothetical protein n=1 Tax=Streptomyces sp. NPDC056713 TaxID=3345921 RepID=UPI0036C8B9FA
MTAPALEEVTYEPPTCPASFASPCAGPRCENTTQKYGPAAYGRPASPLCNVCLTKVEAGRVKPAG